MGTVFGTLKTESLHRYRLTTRERAGQIIFEHIEVFYNYIRRHAKIGNHNTGEIRQPVLHRQATIFGIIQMTCPSAKSDPAQNY